MNLKVNEIFTSIQGEGRFQGYPAIFVRLSGCNLNCNFCDTKYHTKGNEIAHNLLVTQIASFKPSIVVWTGGEPLLQLTKIRKVINILDELIKREYRLLRQHLETNGEILTPSKLITCLDIFDYICVSPKNKKTAERVYTLKQDFGCDRNELDIKVVTDLETVGVDLLPYADILMPLTTYTNKDKKIRQKVWRYCTTHNKLYSSRMHIEVWGKEKGV